MQVTRAMATLALVMEDAQMESAFVIVFTKAMFANIKVSISSY